MKYKISESTLLHTSFSHLGRYWNLSSRYEVFQILTTRQSNFKKQPTDSTISPIIPLQSMAFIQKDFLVLVVSPKVSILLALRTYKNYNKIPVKLTASFFRKYFNLFFKNFFKTRTCDFFPVNQTTNFTKALNYTQLLCHRIKKVIKCENVTYIIIDQSMNILKKRTICISYILISSIIQYSTLHKIRW